MWYFLYLYICLFWTFQIWNYTILHLFCSVSFTDPNVLRFTHVITCIRKTYPGLRPILKSEKNLWSIMSKTTKQSKLTTNETGALGMVWKWKSQTIEGKFSEFWHFLEIIYYIEQTHSPCDKDRKQLTMPYGNSVPSCDDWMSTNWDYSHTNEQGKSLVTESSNVFHCMTQNKLLMTNLQRHINT